MRLESLLAAFEHRANPIADRLLFKATGHIADRRQLARRMSASFGDDHLVRRALGVAFWRRTCR